MQLSFAYTTRFFLYQINTDLVSKWDSIYQENHQYLNIWRKHAQLIKPELNLAELEKVEVNEGKSHSL